MHTPDVTTLLDAHRGLRLPRDPDGDEVYDDLHAEVAAYDAYAVGVAMSARRGDRTGDTTPDAALGAALEAAIAAAEGPRREALAALLVYKRHLDALLAAAGVALGAAKGG